VTISRRSDDFTQERRVANPKGKALLPLGGFGRMCSPPLGLVSILSKVLQCRRSTAQKVVIPKMH